MGLSKTNVALFATGMYGVVKMLSSMCFLLFAADSLGRRRSLLISSVGMTVSLYVVGVYEKTASGRNSNDDVSLYWESLPLSPLLPRSPSQRRD